MPSLRQNALRPERVCYPTMITSTKYGVRIADFYYDEEPHANRADIHRYIQWSSPLPGVWCEPYHTIVVDLNQNEDALLANMDRETRYRIRRAFADDLTYDCYNGENEQTLAEFFAFYDRFAPLVGLPAANRHRLQVLAQNRALDFSTVRQKDEQSLVWHVYHRTNSRVRGLHSAILHRTSSDATFRGLIGRANRYHNWKDMLRFKAAGISVFDLGGWYPGNSDPERLRINRFKEEFGGKVVVNFNGIRAVSMKGKAAIWSQKVLKKQLV